MLKNILLSFIPLFVAVDAIGVLPIFISITGGLEKNERTKIILQSMVTASCLAIGFILVGKLVFRVLGITISDFMIAGGAILFCLSIIDIVNPVKRRRIPSKDLGAVPLGTPLIVGPAVLTTSLDNDICYCQYTRGRIGVLIVCCVNKVSRRGRLKSPVESHEFVACCDCSYVNKKRFGADMRLSNCNCVDGG
jgi:small neutral amino acid transporter SnatA (MarC family)